MDYPARSKPDTTKLPNYQDWFGHWCYRRYAAQQWKAWRESPTNTNQHFRKWLGIPPTFTSIAMYGKGNRQQLPLSSLVEENQDKTGVTYERLFRWICPLSRGCNSYLQDMLSIRDCKPDRELTQKQRHCRTSMYGSTKILQWNRSEQKEKRDMIHSDLRCSEKLARQARAVQWDHREHWIHGTPQIWSWHGSMNHWDCCFSSGLSIMKPNVIKLTVQWKTICEEDYKRKNAKYTEHLGLSRHRGWRTWSRR